MKVFMILLVCVSGCGYVDQYAEQYEAKNAPSVTAYYEERGQEKTGWAVADKVFVGDSITYSKNWQKEWPTEVVLNRGVPETSTIYWESAINTTPPGRETFLAMGINDYVIGKNMYGFFDRYAHIVRVAKSKSDKVYCMSVLPVSHNVNASHNQDLDFVKNEFIVLLNIGIKSVCEENGGKYIDTVGLLMVPGDIELNPMVSTDGLHINAFAYDILVKKINQVISEQ